MNTVTSKPRFTVTFGRTHAHTTLSLFVSERPDVLCKTLEVGCTLLERLRELGGEKRFYNFRARFVHLKNAECLISVMPRVLPHQGC